MATETLDTTPVKVVAVDRGHDGTTIREVGEEFALPAYRLSDGSTWFKAVETEKPEDKPAKK